jgi:hypothetical protein
MVAAATVLDPARIADPAVPARELAAAGSA